MKTIAFVSGTGGAGKTSLVYHLAHMLPRLGYPTLAVDLDPLATLSSLLLGDKRLEEMWDEGTHTVLSSLAPLMDGQEDIGRPNPFVVTESLWGLAGEPALWSLDGPLAEARFECHSGERSAFSRLSAFHRVVQRAGQETKSAVALLDLGSGLGSINQTALLAADFLVFPVAADTFSLHGLKVLGPFIRQWREEWRHLRQRVGNSSAELPEGRMAPVGYVALRLNFFQGRRTRFQAQWMNQIPAVYATEVLGVKETEIPRDDHDESCLALLRNYGSLMSMAQEARKPMFDLTPADGAVGSYAPLVHECFQDFEGLATLLVMQCGVEKPT
ncbi:chromosome partitioning protein [Cystobacter fuscus]|uniref:Chromosome partitioning protein n=1 Tax=Cystobacter fuscus TaxID=43 RepID=A0A250IUX3_9BACT|nr:ParA family protein [Cystobacter fuscus]ATB34987.1 chromosome partitioning protein [Cystobacter fuscus]